MANGSYQGADALSRILAAYGNGTHDLPITTSGWAGTMNNVQRPGPVHVPSTAGSLPHPSLLPHAYTGSHEHVPVINHGYDQSATGFTNPALFQNINILYQQLQNKSASPYHQMPPALSYFERAQSHEDRLDGAAKHPVPTNEAAHPSTSKSEDIVQNENLKHEDPRLDPRTITTWSAALRYTAKLAARNQELGESIRKLIANQHDNERRWWAGREALAEKQKARVDGKRKLDDVLRTVGVEASSSASVDDALELQQYDMKVYRALQKMQRVMSTELESIGVPFFGTKAELVVGTPLEKHYIPVPQGSSTISPEELAALQKRMIQHLEEMYGD